MCGFKRTDNRDCKSRLLPYICTVRSAPVLNVWIETKTTTKVRYAVLYLPSVGPVAVYCRRPFSLSFPPRERLFIFVGINTLRMATISKLSFTARPGQKARASLVNGVRDKINEIIDNLITGTVDASDVSFVYNGGTTNLQAYLENLKIDIADALIYDALDSQSPTTALSANQGRVLDEKITAEHQRMAYAVCTEAAAEQYKTITADIAALNNAPADGTRLSVKFANGSTAAGLELTVTGRTGSYPVYAGGAPLKADAVRAGCVVDMMFDLAALRWDVVGGTGIDLPIRYLDGFTLSNLIAGSYNTALLAKPVVEALVGDGSPHPYETARLMARFDRSFAMLDFVGYNVREGYTFSFISGDKYYEFRISAVTSSARPITVTDAGSDVVTRWME